MPRTKYSEYSATPGDNTDIDGINIGEGMAPSDVNNSLRAFLSQTRDFIDGSSGDTLTSSNIVVTTATILSGVNVTGTATFNSAVILSSSVTGSALSLSGALTVGGATILSSSLGVTGTASMGVIDATTLEVTNLKAKDGTASATIADATGVMTVASAVLTTADINGGTLDNTVIGGATPAAGTFTTGSATTFTATTVDSTNLEVTNLKAKDGTSAGSIADSTGVVTLASAVLTTADINGGTADNVVIGGVTAAAGTFTTATATTGNITNVNATTVDATNVEVTNIKAKDGTAAATIADSTGVVTIPSAVLTTADINGGTVDNAAVGAGTPSTGAFTTLSSNSTTTLNGTTIPASKTLLVSTDIGVTVQGYDADTAKYDDVTANFTGTLQNGGSNVLVDTDIGVNVQAYDAQLADVAGLTPADGSFIVGNGTNFITEDGATARTSLGLGSIATQAANNVDIDGGAVDGVTLGTNAAVTEAQIDNVNINGNAIVSSDTDGDLSLTPNGTGDLILDGLKWPQADGTADYVLKTDGSGQLSWTEQTGGGGTPGGSDTQIQYNSGGSFAGASGLVTDGSNLTLNAQGDVRFADSDSSNWVAFQAPATIASDVTWTLPSADGTSGQVLSTDGSGTLSWASGGGGGSSISAGDSSVAVTDAGTGKVEVTVDNVEVADFTTGAIVFNETGANQDFRVEGDTDANLLFVDAGNERVGVGTATPAVKFHTLFSGSAGAYNEVARFEATAASDTGSKITFFGKQGSDASTKLSGAIGFKQTAAGDSNGQPAFIVETGNNGSIAERARITSAGDFLVGKTSFNFNTEGLALLGSADADGSRINITNDAGICINMNRLTDDGSLVQFFQASILEGSISVSGSTVSYNGGHLARWAQLTTPKDDTPLFKGTVMSNLDEMNLYIAPTTYWTEEDELPEGVNVGDVKEAEHEVENEQLNKVKVSDVEGDANVAGVFVNWTYDEAHQVDEINMAMTGDMIIRIAEGVTVARGDLLMSAGDGTAKPQGDDIVRSKTIAKVTSTHVTCTYDDGSYCVPCVLMAC
jgi:hypothetical protein